MTQTVKIGILGCARINKAAMIDAAKEVPEVELLAVASRDSARAQAYAAKHGIGRAHGGYQALLDDPEVEVVYNPLPNSLHAAWTIRALEAGKAVLCEKPLASNADEARQMIEAARRTGKPLIEAFHYRHHPVAGAIVAHIASGKFGRIVRVEAGLNIPGRLMADDDIRFQDALAGGATMDVGAYCINGLRLVMGEEPVVIRAEAKAVSPRIDGAMRAELTFPGGAAGSFECSLRADTLASWLNIEGERGTLAANNPFLPQMGHSVTVTVDGESVVERFERTASYVYQLRSLVEVLRGGAATPTPGEDGMANMEVIDAVYRAAGLKPRGAHR